MLISSEHPLIRAKGYACRFQHLSTRYLNDEMLTMAGFGSDSSLELALQRMTQALKLAKQREEEFAASRNARSAAETDLRRDCDDCRRPCVLLLFSVTSAPPIFAGRRLQSCGQSRSGSRRCSRSQHAQHASLQAFKFTL